MKPWRLNPIVALLPLWAASAGAEPEIIAPPPAAVVEAPAPVEVETVGAPPLASLGTLTEGAGGFPPDVWKGLDAAQLFILLERLPVEFRSAAMYGLAQRALLTGGAALEGDEATQALVLRARLGHLLAMNEPEAVLEILTQLPKSSDTPPLQRLGVDALLAADRIDEACGMIEQWQETGDVSELAYHRLLCLARQGKEAELQIALGLLEEKQQTPPAHFQAAVEAALAQAGGRRPAAAPETLPALSLLDCAAFRSGGLELPPATLVPQMTRMPPVVLDCAARHLSLPPLARGVAVERLAALGQQKPEHLAESYRLLADEPEPSQPVLAGLRERAALFGAVMATDGTAAADALRRFIPRQPDTAVILSLGSQWNERLVLLWQTLPPAELEPHLLLLAALLTPAEPDMLAERLPATAPYNALVWAADAYRRLTSEAGGQADGPPFPQPEGLPLPVRQKLQVVAGMLGMSADPAAPLGAGSAEALRLGEAARQQRTGEVALRVLYLVGAERPGRLPPADLKAALDALAAVGLEAEARQLAAETLADVALELAAGTP